MVSDMRFCSTLGKLIQKYVVASWSARACVVDRMYRASQIQLCLKSPARDQLTEPTGLESER